ncbi:glycosyltransferase family 2 protein [Bacteroides caecigallinarum]|uniref:glycosyltransferase family 2 protein n=1 Tax=Bacteroides caecigallinarum TaxID=1411144 RepID=UPI00195B4238|nr:glycosyltransferase family 2 protein [Bacteroides caecigallinarum]MBM6866786.1 glycosyltransferase family 2 protein [Bacteroides caecigallinarum]
MDLSIIIPVYNAAPLLNRCLDSIFNQSTQYTYEVILVDDGSTDNSIEIIKSRKEKNIILYQQNNSGPSVARNKGIELSKGEFIAFLDADDYWLEGFIEKTLSFIKSDRNLIAVSVAQRYTVYGKSPMETSFQKYITGSTYILNNFLEFWSIYQHVCTGSLVIRTLVAKEAKGMREDLRITEDLEYWFLLSTYGKWGIIPEILFVSDGGDVTRKEGWLKKMQIRWNNAPSVEEWQKRLIDRIDINSQGYKKAIGVIARNLCYCQLLSGRIELGRNEALKYGKYFMKDKIGKLMNIAKYNSFTWNILAILLKYREYNRK